METVNILALDHCSYVDITLTTDPRAYGKGGPGGPWTPQVFRNQYARALIVYRFDPPPGQRGSRLLCFLTKF